MPSGLIDVHCHLVDPVFESRHSSLRQAAKRWVGVYSPYVVSERWTYYGKTIAGSARTS